MCLLHVHSQADHATWFVEFFATIFAMLGENKISEPNWSLATDYCEPFGATWQNQTDLK